MKEHLILRTLIPVGLSSRGHPSAPKEPFSFVRRSWTASGFSCPRARALLRGVLPVINWLFPTERSGFGINHSAVAQNLYQAVWWGLCFAGTRLEITNYDFTLLLNFLFKPRWNAASGVKCVLTRSRFGFGNETSLSRLRFLAELQ